jgi:hypothetical protein
VLYKLELTVHVILFPQSLFKLQTYNDVGRFCGGVGLSGCCGNQ